jgi:hypothetical protein
MGAQMLRDVHREMADTSRGACDQHALAGAKMRVIRECLQCHAPCKRQCRRIVEADALRNCGKTRGGRDSVFGERSIADHRRDRPEHTLAHVPRRGTAADCDDFACDVASRAARRPAKQGYPAQMPSAYLAIEWIEARRANP